MRFIFNPLTCQFEIKQSTSVGSIVHAFLLDRNDNPSPGQPYITILFDEDSILYHDDEAL